MGNYKVQFFDKKDTPVKDEILVAATSIKSAIREACRIGGFAYPSKYKAKVSEVTLVQSLPPQEEELE